MFSWSALQRLIAALIVIAILAGLAAGVLA